MTLLHPVADDFDGSNPPSDADLILAVRAGDRQAYGTLYERHLAAARTRARQLAWSHADADDLVAEAFAKVFTILRAGCGPDRAFRAYLLTTLRNGLYQRARLDRRLELSDDMAVHDEGIPWSDPVEAELDSSLAARAFSALPERWQTVLWHSEVEGQSTAEIGERMGLRPNAVAALAYRAREGLRQAYLQVHLTDHPDEHCRSTVRRLGGWTRGRLSPGDAALVQEHLTHCDRCGGLAAELADVNGGIRGLLAPLAGAATATGYTASAGSAASLGLAASVATGGAAVPAGGGSVIGSVLGWLVGTHAGQAAAVLTAVVVGGTAVTAGTGAVGQGKRGPAAAAVTAASAGPTGSDPTRVHPAPGSLPETIVLEKGVPSSGKRASGPASEGKQSSGKPSPRQATKKASKAKASNAKASNAKASEAEASKANASKANASKAATPNTTAPKAEAPKIKPSKTAPSSSQGKVGLGRILAGKARPDRDPGDVSRR
jgi:RNA polymerase sigma factor (sigma-70 family)